MSKEQEIKDALAATREALDNFNREPSLATRATAIGQWEDSCARLGEETMWTGLGAGWLNDLSTAFNWIVDSREG